jgi:multiple RNA-binding domain-containing protein 1
LKEFLEVMQPASKTKTWDSLPPDGPANDSTSKTQAKKLSEEESDEEYEAVPKKTRTKTSPEVPTEPVLAAMECIKPGKGKETVPEPMTLDTTDDDWLRGHTNRLLDLVDPDDILISKDASKGETVDPVTKANPDIPMSDNLEEPPPVEEEWEGLEDDIPDPVIEAIKSNGRLFVRNLPYSATEDELREHFGSYGALEEVREFFT